MKKQITQIIENLRYITVACAFFFIANISNAQAIKILPLGNSITQSNNENLSYRYPLWTKLIDSGLDFDFVGSMTSNYGGNPVWPQYNGENFDQDHEGHWGWRVDQINSNLSGWLSGYTPDIVLVHMGTNDVAQNNSVASTINELKDLITLLRADNPNVKVLLATLIPADDLLWTWAYKIPLLNAEIPSIAVEMSTTDSPIYIIDQYNGFDPVTDTFDGVHPNEDGEEKMAQKWIDGIDNAFGGLKLNLNIYLEGPFLNGEMDTNLIPVIPLYQPFHGMPWNYQGSELIANLPPGSVDWILVELRDAVSVNLADGSAIISRQACILGYDSRIMNVGGSYDLDFNTTITDSLFVVIWHRNHLPVISSRPLIETSGIYSFDFTAAVDNAHLSSQKNLGSGKFGLIAGDLNADGYINIDDLSDSWSFEVGKKGYLPSDIDFNTEIDNKDKNNMILDNLGSQSGLPEYN